MLERIRLIANSSGTTPHASTSITTFIQVNTASSGDTSSSANCWFSRSNTDKGEQQQLQIQHNQQQQQQEGQGFKAAIVHCHHQLSDEQAV
jgi:hypothetical protein